MDLAEAWNVFGRQLPDILAEAKGRPREERVPFVEGLLEEAKRVKKALQFAHHPDRGGDPAMFKKVADAYEAIERGTAEFKTAFESVPAERPSSKSVRIVIDPLK